MRGKRLQHSGRVSVPIYDIWNISASQNAVGGRKYTISFHFISFHCIAFHCNELKCDAMNYNEVHCISFHCISFHFIFILLGVLISEFSRR